MKHWVRIEGAIRELSHVAALPGAVLPSAIGFKTDAANHAISIDGPDPWRGLRP